MRKRIKNFLNEEDEVVDQINENQEKDYLALLVSDLKKEAETMPKYSLWSGLVNKCLEEQSNKN